MNFEKIDLKDGILYITNDDNSITCIPQERCSYDTNVQALFDEFRAEYPEGKPIVVSLEDTKASKIAELSNKCNETILNGFYSDVDGENKLYDFELENQVNLGIKSIGVATSLVSGQVVDSISYYAKGEICHDYTPEQFLKLAQDGENFKTATIQKYKDILKPMVEECTSIEEVQAITWDSISI